MINSLAISLAFTSLLAAQFYSGKPQNQKEDVIVKEGHRDVVVESYDRNGCPVTKVSFSPPQDPITAVDDKFPSGIVDNAKDKIKQGVSSVFVDTPKFLEGGEGYSTGELISDAFDKGMCKNNFEKAREKASETAHTAKEVVENAYRTATKTSSIAKGVEDAVGKVTGKASEKANTVKEVVENTYGKATESASERLHDAKEAIGDAARKATGKASETANTEKEVLGNASRTKTGNASEKVHDAKEVVEDVFGKATEKVYGKASETAHGAKEVVENAYGIATEKASEKVYGAKEVVENAYRKATTETVHGAKEVVGDALGKAWRIASEKSQGAREAVHEATEEAEDVAYERTKNFAAHKAHNVKDTTIKSLKQVKDTAKTTKDTGKTIGTDAATNVSQQVGNLKHISGIAARSIFKGLKNGIKYFISGKWLNPLFGVINLLGISLAYGMGMWVTFISSHVLAGSLPRHQFGLVQSNVYPVYFRAMGLSLVMALLGHIGGYRKTLFSNNKAGRLQVLNLLASLLVDLINAFYLGPLATKVMLEKFRLEKEEGRGREMQGPAEEAGIVETAIAEATAEAEQREMRERMRAMNQWLKKLNSYSAFLNILTLMGLSWHLVHLGQGFHLTS